MKNFAIIGCGRIAGRHAEHLVKHGKLVAVCDSIPEAAHNFGPRGVGRNVVSRKG